MKFVPTTVDGCVVVEAEPYTDSRGSFARIFDAAEFRAHDLDPAVVQGNMSGNHLAGTIRGLHRQIPPYAEGKLVRCVSGAIVDVCLDLREDSPTFGKHVIVELSADNALALYVPPYCGHGYQTLTDDTQVIYQVTGPYVPEGERGQRYDDPAFGIVWPLQVTAISEKDATWPDWDGKRIR